MQQGWRVIIVVVHVGAAKIYVATVEALTKKERGDQNRMKLSFAPKKNGAFPSFTPPLQAKVPFLQGFLKISPGFGPNSGFWCRVFPNFTKNSIIP